jgi:hypothetical protein
MSPRLRTVALICLAYVAIAFSYSLIAFLHVQSVTSLPEYTYSSFVLEILGHFTFGVIASIPFLDFEFALIGGVCSVLIDSDHLLDGLNFAVSGRPDHSIFFAALSAFMLVLVAKKLHFTKASQIKVGFLAPVIVTNHIAYDILYAGGASSFQLFIPFSFQEVTLPYSDWDVLLFAAIMIASIGYLVARRVGESRIAAEAPNSERSVNEATHSEPQ